MGHDNFPPLLKALGFAALFFRSCARASASASALTSKPDNVFVFGILRTPAPKQSQDYADVAYCGPCRCGAKPSISFVTAPGKTAAMPPWAQQTRQK